MELSTYANSLEPISKLRYITKIKKVGKDPYLLAYSEAGWLKDVKGTRVSQMYVILGKVFHSQRLNEKPLETWVLVGTNGEIDCAHCKCKAGLFETCSHVGIVLFALECVYRAFTANPTEF